METVPKTEIEQRIGRFQDQLAANDLEGAFVLQNADIFYFTGTIQSSVLRMRGWNQEMTYAHVLSGDSGAVVSLLKSPHGGSGNTPAMAQGPGFRRVKKNEPKFVFP